MTKRKASAPNQVELIKQINSKIEHSGFEFLTDSEKVNNTILLEGEWDYRVNRFIEEHISEDKLWFDYTRAILARLYRGHLPKAVYEKHTRVLNEPLKPKMTQEEIIKGIRKMLKR